jgi:hypothetical protein
MVLRNLADAIREQNWSTVILEVLIVVVGILIGLQVDGWNEGRKKQQDIEVQLLRIADLLNPSPRRPGDSGIIERFL